jgi:hypothetical protein
MEELTFAEDPLDWELDQISKLKQIAPNYGKVPGDTWFKMKLKLIQEQSIARQKTIIKLMKCNYQLKASGAAKQVMVAGQESKRVSPAGWELATGEPVNGTKFKDFKEAMKECLDKPKYEEWKLDREAPSGKDFRRFISMHKTKPHKFERCRVFLLKGVSGCMTCAHAPYTELYCIFCAQVLGTDTCFSMQWSQILRRHQQTRKKWTNQNQMMDRSHRSQRWRSQHPMSTRTRRRMGKAKEIAKRVPAKRVPAKKKTEQNHPNQSSHQNPIQNPKPNPSPSNPPHHQQALRQELFGEDKHQCHMKSHHQQKRKVKSVRSSLQIASLASHSTSFLLTCMPIYMHSNLLSKTFPMYSDCILIVF